MAGVRNTLAMACAPLLLACAAACLAEDLPPLRLPDPDEVERLYNERRAAEKLRETAKPDAADPAKRSNQADSISHIADKPKDDDLAPDARREKVRKEMQERIEQARKAAEAKVKREDGSSKEKPRKGDMVVDSTGEGHTIDLRGSEKGRKKGDSIVIDGKGGDDDGHQINLGFKKENPLPQVGPDGVVRYVPAGGPMSTTNDGDAKDKVMRLADPNKKRSFWDKLWGKKEEPPSLLAPTALKSGEMNNLDVNTSPANVVDATPQTSLMRRLQAEMAAKRLAQETALREEQAGKEGGDLPPATVVDLDKEAKKEGAAKPPPSDRTQVTPLNEVSKGVAMKQDLTEDELKQALELRFQKGLAARDIVDREWAFRYATAYGRKEAIPAMMKEVQDNNVLASMSILSLSVLDPQNREAERLFLGALNAKEGGVRQAGAVALGRMRSEAAVRPMAKMLKDEKNYQVRKAICESLGGIGGNASMETLRGVIADKEEIDEVRAQAALSLTVLGDRSGKDRLVNSLASLDPNQQLTGLLGLVQTSDPDTGGYLSAALESRHDGVWTVAAQYFPCIGPTESLRLLRPKLQSNNPVLRRRAALALGMVGSDEGLPYIEDALRDGDASERMMAASLLGAMQRREQIPLLIEKLRDPQSAVRKAAALSLATLDAKQAEQALMEAARGARGRQDLPPAMRARAPAPDITEQLVMLDAIRSLRGETQVMEFKSAPDLRNMRWPEYDKQLFTRQVDLLKSYKLLDVMSVEGRPVAAVLQDASGREILVRRGETVASGFQVSDLIAEQVENGRVKTPAMLSLLRGNTRVTLAVGRDAEVNSTKSR
ncbi:MAG: HEAT repeat domain-containing protein [Planctomycetota bacterium]|nr:HEAT repeat domain-containing protein [Planctomycetota bacterium]